MKAVIHWSKFFEIKILEEKWETKSVGLTNPKWITLWFHVHFFGFLFTQENTILSASQQTLGTSYSVRALVSKFFTTCTKNQIKKNMNIKCTSVIHFAFVSPTLFVSCFSFGTFVAKNFNLQEKIKIIIKLPLSKVS